MLYNWLRPLATPFTIWKLKYGRVVMVVGEPYTVGEREFLNVINQSDNKDSLIYFDELYEATKIG